jgi:hypothetical protein
MKGYLRPSWLPRTFIASILIPYSGELRSVVTQSTEKYGSIKKLNTTLWYKMSNKFVGLRVSGLKMKYIGGVRYFLIYSDESLAALAQYIVVEPSDTKLSSTAIYR